MKRASPKYSIPWFIIRFEQAKNRADQLAKNVSEKTFLQKPAPDKWSAAECLNHLVAFGNMYYETINFGLEQAAVDTVSGEKVFEPRLFWRWIARIFEPPYRMKLNTLSPFEPTATFDYSGSETCKSFALLQDRFVNQLERSRQKGIDLNAEKVENPALSFVKMQLSECYAVVEAHQRRHLWQAEQVVHVVKQNV